MSSRTWRWSQSSASDRESASVPWSPARRQCLPSRPISLPAHALASSRLADAKQLNVIDFGSGKGYLTFAIHDWLRHAKGVQAQVTGVELPFTTTIALISFTAPELPE